jgi:CubicO group peptidase (beta-lactamase class C family)
MAKPRLACLTALMLLLAVFASSPLGIASVDEKADKIDRLMSIYHDYGQFNGAVLVAENGKVILRKGYGMANMEWGIPNAPDTRFRLGSITKQFTSMLVLQQVERGKIKLDGHISDYLPYYRADTGGKVSIHQLLSQTSGIPSYTSDPKFQSEVSRNPYTPDEFVKKFCSGDLEFEPGTKFRYDNSGYFILGAILEKVAGKPYEQLLKQNILEPVGMKNTGYDHYGAILEKRAAGYERSLGGFDNAPYLDMSLPYAAGSLYSTVEDLYLWDQALYGETLLAANLKELLFKPNLQGYGYGWVIMPISAKDPGGPGTLIMHNGGINGFNTLLVRLVRDKHLIVLLNNTGGTSLNEMALNIRNVLYGRETTPPRRSLAVTLGKTISEKGVEAALAQYAELRKTKADEYNFSETELNRLGYGLLQANRIKDAIAIFGLNVETHPKSGNVYDSLAEAYMKDGQRKPAMENYRKSLELTPENKNAQDMLKRLAAEPEQAGKVTAP